MPTGPASPQDMSPEPFKPVQTGPQTMPGNPDSQAPTGPRKPGVRLAKTLMDMQFNRQPQSTFGALAGLADIGADAWNERRARRAGVYPTEE